jgi:DNA polymerase-3 subunit delta'
VTLAPWHEENWRLLAGRRARGTLPHALLLCGPQGLGKREFAERVAQMLLCENEASAPCEQCRSCRLFSSRNQRDPAETRADGTLAHPNGHPGHPDARFVGHVLNEKSSPKKMYSELVVEQMRDLSAWLAMPPQFGRAQVSLIDPADELNTAASNALLKTLEEPGAGRHLILISSRPARLSATIRSRCQRVEFSVPSAALALAWLSARGVNAREAGTALAAASGNPGLALGWIKGGGMTLREEVGTDLRALCGGKVSAVEVANRWSRDDLETRLWFAAALVRDEAQAASRGQSGPLALTPRPDFTKLAAWFEQANRARAQLRGPLRPELVALEVLSAVAAQAAHAT